MAQRKIFLIAQYDSNLIGHIDLTDGTYNAVEHNHSSCTDELFKIGNDLYVSLEDYGGRVAKYHGDGKFGPSSEDLGVARPNKSADTGSIVLNQRFPTCVGLFLRMINIMEWGAPDGYQIVDAQDNVKFEVQNNFWQTIYPQYPAFDLAPGVQYAGQGSGFSVSDSWTDSGRIYILRGGAVFLADGKLAQILYGSDNNFYMVESTMAADGTCSDMVSTLVGSAADFPIATDNITLLPDGRFMFTDNGPRTWVWSGSGAPEELMGLPWGFIDRVRTAVAGSQSVIYEFDSGEVNTYERGSLTQSLSRYNVNTLAKEVVELPVISEIPAGLVDITTHNFGVFDGMKIMYIGGFKAADNSLTHVGALLVENYNTGTYKWFGNLSAQMQIGRPCPQGELDDDSCVLVDLQPYEVTGVIEKDGSAAGTLLILVDNDSMNIVGRTKSDPVTGAYKFRCYTNRKKSVFAQHPVSKGLRLASEVTPKLL